MVALALAAGTAGLLSLAGWLVPHFTEGILPAGFVSFFERQFEEGRDAAAWIHLASGILLGVAAALWAFLAWRRHAPWFLVPRGGETATSAFWRWALGLFIIGRRRIHRLHFRDMLLLPAAEFAVALAIAAGSFLLAVIPWGPLRDAGLAIHRINGLYMAFLGAYSLLVLAFRERGDSPYATVIRGGRLVRRPVRYVQDVPA